MSQTYDTISISPDLADRLRAMPKVEIHIHAEGATDAETFYQMAQRNRVELPTDSLEEWKSFFEFRDFSHFIQVYTAAVKCLQTPKDYALMIERLYKRQSEENILYTEAFVSASFLTQKFEDDEILDAILAGRTAGEANYVKVLRQNQIPLEVSPHSNYCLCVVERDQPHPIRKMVDAGLYCTINSDDPAMFSTSLTNEYLTLALQGFSWEELWQLNLNTLEATFLDEVEKDRYLVEWEKFMRSVS